MFVPWGNCSYSAGVASGAISATIIFCLYRVTLPIDAQKYVDEKLHDSRAITSSRGTGLSGPFKAGGTLMWATSASARSVSRG